MTEQEYQVGLSHAEDGADIPKAPGDLCDETKCDGVLLMEDGWPGSKNEPEQPAIVYCPKCGSDYLPDWSRIAPAAQQS